MAPSLNAAARDYVARLRGFTPPVRRLLVFGLFAGLGIAAFALLFNLYLKSLGYREDFIGFLASVNGLATAATALIAGMVSDRVGRQRMLAIGITLEALSVLGRSLATSQPALIALSVLAGIALPLWMVSFNPFLMEHSQSEERVHLFSVANAIWLATGFTGSILGGLVPTLYAHLTQSSVDSPQAYRAGIWVAFLLYLGACVTAFTIREGEGRTEQVVSRTRLGPLPKETKRHVAQLTLVTACVGLGVAMFYPFMNLFFKDYLGAPPSAVGFILALNQGLALLGTLAAPVLAVRLGRVRTVSFLLVIMSPVLLGVAFIRILPVAAGLLYLRTALVNTWGPSYDTFMLDLVPASRRATIVSLASIPSGVAFNLAWAIGTAAAGLLIVRIGYPANYTLAAVFYAAAGVLYFRAFASLDSPPRPVKELKETPSPPP